MRHIKLTIKASVGEQNGEQNDDTEEVEVERQIRVEFESKTLPWKVQLDRIVLTSGWSVDSSISIEKSFETSYPGLLTNTVATVTLFEGGEIDEVKADEISTFERQLETPLEYKKVTVPDLNRKISDLQLNVNSKLNKKDKWKSLIVAWREKEKEKKLLTAEFNLAKPSTKDVGGWKLTFEVEEIISLPVEERKELNVMHDSEGFVYVWRVPLKITTATASDRNFCLLNIGKVNATTWMALENRLYAEQNAVGKICSRVPSIPCSSPSQTLYSAAKMKDALEYFTDLALILKRTKADADLDSSEAFMRSLLGDLFPRSAGKAILNHFGIPKATHGNFSPTELVVCELEVFEDLRKLYEEKLKKHEEVKLQEIVNFVKGRVVELKTHTFECSGLKQNAFLKVVLAVRVKKVTE